MATALSVPVGGALRRHRAPSRNARRQAPCRIPGATAAPLSPRPTSCRPVLGNAKGRRSGLRPVLTTAAASGVDASLGPRSAPGSVKVVTVVGSGEESPYDASWYEVMSHMSKRLNWADEALNMVVLKESANPGEIEAALKGADLLVAAGVTSAPAVASLLAGAAQVPTRMFFEGDPMLEAATALNGRNPNAINPIQMLLGKLSFTREAKDQMLWRQVNDLWGRRSSEDLLYCFLFVIHRYVAEVALIPNETTLDTITCMVGNCREALFACVADEQCKKGLDCLDECGLNDQVCSYRCIVSYESELFEQFSLCILQKHNCLGNSAEVPTRPEVQAMTSFRGQPMTWEAAEEIFVGWLGEREASWRVVCGVNPAYDYFPCQYQLFYFGKGRNVMWYDPTFKVKTFTGEEVWRRRHYRVRRGEEVGTFYFSVLDNGVTSNEFWRIADCADDMSWALFYYAGAAAAAGISYTGAVLGTPDGEWPPESETPKVVAALKRCGIEMWEICRVDNKSCVGAPLEIDPKVGTFPQIADRKFPPGAV